MILGKRNARVFNIKGGFGSVLDVVYSRGHFSKFSLIQNYMKNLTKIEEKTRKFRKQRFLVKSYLYFH